MPQFEPCNDHELVIARHIDQLAIAGSLAAPAICEVLGSLEFMVSPRDCQFLASYVHWRRDHPIS
jgi:hypothetical protein